MHGMHQFGAAAAPAAAAVDVSMPIASEDQERLGMMLVLLWASVVCTVLARFFCEFRACYFCCAVLRGVLRGVVLCAHSAVLCIGIAG